MTRQIDETCAIHYFVLATSLVEGAYCRLGRSATGSGPANSCPVRLEPELRRYLRVR